MNPGRNEKTKDGTFQVKRKQVVDDDPSADPQDQMDESSSEREEATFSEMRVNESYPRRGRGPLGRERRIDLMRSAFTCGHLARIHGLDLQ